MKIQIKEKESDIQKAILTYLKFRKIFAWKNNSAGIYLKKTGSYIPMGMTGISDILGILPNGRFLAIEVKTKIGKLSENQEAFIAEITSRKGLAIVARSVDDVHNVLSAL